MVEKRTDDKPYRRWVEFFNVSNCLIVLAWFILNPVSHANVFTVVMNYFGVWIFCLALLLGLLLTFTRSRKQWVL